MYQQIIATWHIKIIQGANIFLFSQGQAFIYAFIRRGIIFTITPLAFLVQGSHSPRPHISILETAIKFGTTEENTPLDLLSGHVSRQYVWRIDWKSVIVLEEGSMQHAILLAIPEIYLGATSLLQDNWSRKQNDPSSSMTDDSVFRVFLVFLLFFSTGMFDIITVLNLWPRKKVNSCWQGQRRGGLSLFLSRLKLTHAMFIPTRSTLEPQSPNLLFKFISKERN